MTKIIQRNSDLLLHLCYMSSDLLTTNFWHLVCEMPSTKRKTCSFKPSLKTGNYRNIDVHEHNVAQTLSIHSSEQKLTRRILSAALCLSLRVWTSNYHLSQTASWAKWVTQSAYILFNSPSPRFWLEGFAGAQWGQPWAPSPPADARPSCPPSGYQERSHPSAVSR